MADSKKYNGSTWEHSLRKLTTATDTITTLPVDVYADGNTATVGLKGNTVQNGAPTPDNPIMPQGTGERTENLFDATSVAKGRINSSTGVVEYAEDTPDLTYSGTNNEFTITTIYSWRGFVTDYLDLQKKPAFSYISDETFYSFSYAYDANKNYLGAITSSAPTGTKYIRVSIQCSTQVTNAKIKDIMLNTGSTAIPYEPYGYKLTISSANTTTPIYLNEVESTRQIRKFVLTGNEQFYGVEVPNTNTMIFNFADLLNTERFIPTVLSLSTHYVYNPIQSGMVVGLPINQYALQFYAPGSNYNLLIHDSICTSVSAFQTYLQQQYANGTPICVWYVLAEPETGIVNEPLMRIGDYADTVSGITVPTITGKNTFDIDTTLKPSEAFISYTGWHDATVKEWDGSQWNE